MVIELATDLHSKIFDAAPTRFNFHNFHAFYDKFWPNNRLAPLLWEILDPPLRIVIVILTGSASVLVHLVSAIAIHITARNRVKRWTGNILMFFTFTCLGI